MEREKKNEVIKRKMPSRTGSRRRRASRRRTRSKSRSPHGRRRYRSSSAEVVDFSMTGDPVFAEQLIVKFKDVHYLMKLTRESFTVILPAKPSYQFTQQPKKRISDARTPIRYKVEEFKWFALDARGLSLDLPQDSSQAKRPTDQPESPAPSKQDHPLQRFEDKHVENVFHTLENETSIVIKVLYTDGTMLIGKGPATLVSRQRARARLAA